jgi:adenylate kinase family enzyme
MELSTRTTGKNNFLIDGFPRSLNNLDGWCNIMGKEMELPKMMYFDCAYDVLEKRVMGRSKYSGRSDDNLESIKLRFDTFKADTLPTVEFFKNKGRCVEIDASQGRQSVYDYLKSNLTDYTDEKLANKPLTEKSEILLGLRPYPKN